MNQNEENQEIKSSSKNMIVAVRSRPLSKIELEYSNIKTIEIQNSKTLIITEPTQYNYIEEGSKYINKDNALEIIQSKQTKFEFDYAFDEHTQQEDIYHFTTENLIESVMEGYNGTVFAYGATGSGKTYTMVGDKSNHGIMIRALNDLFNALSEVKDKKYNVNISYIEVYNEQLKDLLDSNNNRKKIDARFDPQKGVILFNAIQSNINNANDAFRLLEIGNKNRTEKKTLYNINSSRSHAILLVNVESQDSQLSSSNKVAFGKLFLVDLAGSEKVSISSKADAETGNINKSLLALGKCIKALTSKRKVHVPIRDSKLTYILQESFSGNCRISMIATISPSLMFIDETLHTLQYANEAKKIKITIKKNIVDNRVLQVSKLDQYIQSLKSEINNIRMEIAEKEKVNMSMDVGEYQMDNSETYEQLKKDLINHFEEEIAVKNEIINKEKEIEMLKVEISENELNMNSNPTINTSAIQKMISSKKSEIDNKIKNISINYTQQSNLMSKRKEFEKKINEIIDTDNESPAIKNIINIYKYYIALLENMYSEHRNDINQNEIKRKDIKIQILTNQLDLRDNFIYNAGKEIANQNGTFKFNNPKFQSADEIEINPFKPKIVKVYPIFNNLIKKTSNINNENINNVNDRNINNNLNKKNFPIKKIQSRNSPVKITKHRQFDDDVQNLGKKKKNMSIYLEKFQRKKPLRANLSEDLINNGKNIIRDRNVKNIFNNNNQSMFSSYDNDNNLNKSNLNRSNDNSILSPNVSRFESEIEKKVKNILSKNLIGRFKKSPYVKEFY